MYTLKFKFKIFIFVELYVYFEKNTTNSNLSTLYNNDHNNLNYRISQFVNTELNATNFYQRLSVTLIKELYSF